MNQSLKNTKKDVKSNSIWLLVIGLTCTTVYFNQNFEDPFNTPKMIILMLTASWLAGHVIQYYFKTNVKLHSQKFWALTLGLLFVFSQLIALLNTDVPIVGLIGETQRRNGFLSYFALVVVFLYLSIHFNYNYSLRLIKVSIFIGLVLSSYGLLQIAGKDFVKWNNPYNSMISTLGNPNFASAMLALMTIISTALLFIKSFQKIYKLLSIIVIINSILAIIQSDSIQGLLVILTGLAFYFGAYTYFNHKRLRIMVIALCLFTFGLISAGILQFGPLAGYLYKDSVSVRGYYWESAVEMFKAQPLTGVGLDSYGSYFKEFRDAGYPLKYGYEITSTNAHNVYLQLFSTGGLLVGLSYALILIFVLVLGLKAVRNSIGDEQKIMLLFLSTWISFQSQSLISIDNIGISIWGWTLSGCIIGLATNSSLNSIDNPWSNLSKTRTISINLFQPIVSAIVLVPTLIISISLWRSESTMFLVRNYAYSDLENKRSLVYDSAQKLINDKFSDPNYKFNALLHMVDVGYLNESYEQIEILHRNDPRNLSFLHWLAEYKNSTKKFSEEVSLRRSISVLDPWNAVNYLKLGIAYRQLGELENAKRMYEKITSFAPESDIAKTAAVELL